MSQPDQDYPSIDDVLANHFTKEELDTSSQPEPVVQPTVVSEEDKVEAEESEEGVNEDQEAAAEDGEESVSEDEGTVEEQAKEEPEEESRFRFSWFKKQKQQTEQLQESLAAQKAEIEAKQAEIEAKQKEIAEQSENLNESALKKLNPLKLLKKFGHSLEDLSADAIGEYTKPEPDPVQERLDLLKQKEEEINAALERLKEQEEAQERARKEEEQREAMLKVDAAIKAEVDSDLDEYELLAKKGDAGRELVWEVMLKYHEEEGKWLDYSEACAMVEGYFVEEAKFYAESKKVKQMSGGQSASKSSPQKKEVTKPTTLKNRDTSVTTSRKAMDEMSREEAINHMSSMLSFNEGK